MARESANIDLEIWNDPDFQELTPTQQRLYTLLFSQKNTNNAGVLPLMPSKWARASRHTTVEDVEADLAVLEATRFVLVDRTTEEVLVRSFIRRDGVAKQKYLLKNALAMAKRTESPTLRHALAVELRRLGNPEADAVADALAVSPSGTPPEPRSNGIPTAPEPQSNAYVVVEGVVASSGDRSTNVDVEFRRPRSQAKRGTRIPDDFSVSAEMVEWARERVPDVDGRLETEKFVNHWSAKTGKDATKLDWVATWRNWMLNANSRLPARASPNGVNRNDAKIANFLNRPGQVQSNLRALPGGVS
jgi:hypothetical protein